jgi:hypothetical protein
LTTAAYTGYTCTQKNKVLKLKIHKRRDKEEQRENLQASKKEYYKGVRKIPHSEKKIRV